MRCGRSHHKGIMIYDSKSQKGIYGYYENNEVIIIEGTVEQLDSYFKESSHKKLHYAMIIVFISEIILSFYSIFHFPFIITFSLLLFFIMTFIKLLTIIYTFLGDDSPENHQQFKRFHACEHKLLNIEGEVTLEKLKEASMFHIDCGTVHACNIVFFWAIFCLLLAHIMSIGLLKFILGVVVLIIILIINLFNPYNPFFIVQKQVVSNPSNYEYNLALRILEKYDKIT